ncbi:glycine betaine ABC transporter substrate-binding protein [Virgibacillus siamensis]|uniref:glycine betaine ABC transporter substrate-binding protein n=1 Tax=Virgibacillus siamensis TaxID=480071 RepID=UPI0009842963|nr:glycine betaine ABC transporter substrate-binding protein [Virgibacillus siamensis]
MKEVQRWTYFIVVITLLLFVIAGCSSDSAKENGDGSAEEKDKGTIHIGLQNWAETIAVANMWKIVLEDKGYDVKLTSVTKGALYSGLADGSIDVNLEVWLPHTDKPYVQRYKEDIVKHDGWYKNTRLGLAVPEYVDIDSMDELNSNKKAFDGKIIGIEPGASLMKMTDKAVKEYNLDYDLIESSGPSMTAQLKKKYEEKEPIVVTLWNPHWAFAVWDLKYLDDPKNVYGKPDSVYWYSRKNFKEEFPEVSTWLDQWDMSHKQLSSLMNVIRKNDNEPKKGAARWIENHQKLIEKWVAEKE